MDANVVNLETLFSKPVSYRIPQFQRPYAWKQDAQWGPLWEDVLEMMNLELELSDSDASRPHFMGAIVLYPQSNTTGEVEKRLVVDGQQRLTTLQLLIKATEEAFRFQNETDRANRLTKLTRNDDSYWSGDDANDTKIRQSNQNDQTAFQHVIRHYQSGGQSKLSPISDGFEFFKAKVETWLNDGSRPWSEKADALERSITKGFQIAAIDLDEAEQPHVIFETLNERGEPLSQSDRIKNTVMYKANVVDDPLKARELWADVFENSFWRKATNEGRLVRTHDDRFLNYWVVMKTRDDVASDRVAKAFRKFVDLNDNTQIDEIAEEIKNSGVFYRRLEEDLISDMKTFLRRMRVLEVGVITPLLLWVDAKKVIEERRTRFLGILESYLVRRMLCGYGTQGLNRYFVEVLSFLEDQGPEVADEALVEHLGSATIDNRIWPTDFVLRQKLTEGGLRGNARRQAMVLEAIEGHLRPDKAEPLIGMTGLTLEHIMPQKWESHWPLPEDSSVDTQAGEIRNVSVKELGNLTLVTGKLNSAISNGPWVEKRIELNKHSILFLNKTLLEDAPEVWNEDAIRERTHKLANVIAEIWPHADNI